VDLDGGWAPLAQEATPDGRRRPNAVIPAIVVVDSRNVHGQAGEVLGRKQRTTVAGVIAALHRYGFDAISVHVGIGLVGNGRNLSPAMTAAKAQNDAYAREVDAHPAGDVLRGRLVERDGLREEKLVDVLCAVRVCQAAYDVEQGRSPARAIVVISKDIDISPSFAFAQGLGVPVYAMAVSVVHTRPGPWLLATEDAFLTLCAPGVPTADGSPSPPAANSPAGSGPVGSPLRAALAAMLMPTPGAPSPLRPWRALYEERRRGGSWLVLRDVDGIDGVLPTTDLPGWRKNGLYQLAAVNADFGDRFGLFPRALLSTAPGPVSRELEVVQVGRWLEPTRVRVAGSFGSKPIDVAPGSVMPGDTVLVRTCPRDPVSGQRPVRLVGPVSLLRRPAGWGEQSSPVLIEVTGATKFGDAAAKLDGTGGACVVKLPRGDTPVAGARYAAVLVDVLRGPQPLLMAVSSRLPA
jgi:hypothetical protein